MSQKNHEEVLKGLIHVFSSNIWFITPGDNLSSHTDLTKKFIGLQKCTQPAATCLTFKLCCSLSSMWCFQSTSFQQFSQYKTKSLPDLKEGFNISCALFASFSRDTIVVPQIRSSEMFHLNNSLLPSGLLRKKWHIVDLGYSTLYKSV